MKRTIPIILVATLFVFITGGYAQTNFENGVNNVRYDAFGGQMPVLDPTQVHAEFLDWNNYISGDLVLDASEGAGSITETISTGIEYSALVIGNVSGATSAEVFQRPESFTIESGENFWFRTRFKLSSLTAGKMLMGLHQLTWDDYDNPVHGMYFICNSDGGVDLHMINASGNSTEEDVATIAADTFIDLGLFYNGTDLEIWNAGIHTDTLVASELTYMPTEEIGFAGAVISTATGIQKNGYVDYSLIMEPR